jgi:hypothetical protein
MPLPCWFGQCRSKQHGPGLITGPQRLVINQWRHERALAEQRHKVRVECEGSVESRFAWFVPKLVKGSGKLGVHFPTINSVKFGRSSEYGNARGSRSMDKKSGVGNELVSIVD